MTERERADCCISFLSSAWLLLETGLDLSLKGLGAFLAAGDSDREEEDEEEEGRGLSQ